MATSAIDTRIPWGPDDYPTDHVPSPRLYRDYRQPPTPTMNDSRTSSFSMMGPPPSFAESVGSYTGLDSSDSVLPKYGSVPPEELVLTNDYLFTPRLFVASTTRSPDLTVTTGDDQPLYHFETDSTFVYHETYVKDLRGPFPLFNIRRYPVQDKAEGTWRYTIHIGGTTRYEKGYGGTKILEIDTDPGMLLGGRNKSWQTRLIFRNAKTKELDGLTLCVTQEGLRSKGMGAEVLYQGKKVADIIDRQKKDPGFEVRIFRQGLDPLLVVILAYVMDDRVMGPKRRNRRSRAAGLPGIGKGPGAGLAGVYAVGALM